MRGINKVFVGGNLTKAPDVRKTFSGKRSAYFTLAVNSKVNVKGTIQDRVSFVAVVAYGRTAEICEEYLAKGSPCFVEGRLEQIPDDEGNRKTKVVAETVQLLGSGRQTEEEES